MRREREILPRFSASARRSTIVHRATLEQAVPNGYAVRVPERGTAYKIMTPLLAIDATLSVSLTAAYRSSQAPVLQRLAACCGCSVSPEELLFVDLETTGLGQTPLFLIGAMTCADGEFVIRQFFAREYREEPAIIQLFMELAADKRVLVTFNGKSFDLPMLRQRAEANEMLFVVHAAHFDLLHESRRAWRDDLPNCQLQTLEQQICGHPSREDDIPGDEIPKAYHNFVLNGNAMQIAQIIRHNQRDLVTMAELLTHLPPDK